MIIKGKDLIKRISNKEYSEDLILEWNEEEILQELVNKTMPMTPKKELMTGSGTTAIYAIVCGDCEGEVEKHFSYCPYCSQQIDWKNHDE